jgi:origin recognition complex subunit 4
MAEVVTGSLDLLAVPRLLQDIVLQVEEAAWGLASAKLKGLSQPAVGCLIIAKHLSYIGREEFTFAMVEEEYLRFARTKLVGSGRTRWPLTILRSVSEYPCICFACS